MTETTIPNGEQPSTLTFKYVNCDHLNDCFVSGFYGSIAPSRKIHCHFFSERPALPEKETIEIMPEGKLGKRLSIDREADIVRLIQASIVFDVHTAKEMIGWLQQQVARLEQPQKEQSRVLQ